MISMRLTLAGANLLTKALNGATLSFKRAALGSGKSGAVPDDTEMDELTQLYNEKLSLPITNYAIQNNRMVCECLVSNALVQTGFRAKEIGLIAEDSKKNEVLYAYSYLGEESDYIHAALTEIIIEYSLEIVVQISNAADVNIKLFKNVEVTRADLDEHIADSLPHPNYVPVYARRGLTNTNWTLDVNFKNETIPADKSHLTGVVNFDGGFNVADSVSINFGNADSVGGNPYFTGNPTFKNLVASPTAKGLIKIGRNLSMDGESLNADFSLPTASASIKGAVKIGKNLYMENESLNAAGGETDDIVSRLNQIEVNLANLYIRLENDYTGGKRANLLLVDDFINTECTHKYHVDSYSTESKKYLRVDAGNMRVGGFYTISDGGIYNQDVKIADLKKDDLYNMDYLATLDETLPRDYKKRSDKYPQLLRSTVTIKDNKAYGAGEIKTYTRQGTDTWKGESTVTSQTLTMDTSAGKEDKYSLEGDWTLTADGFFTLE